MSRILLLCSWISSFTSADFIQICSFMQNCISVISVHEIRMILRSVSPCLLLFLSHLWSEFATSRILFTFQSRLQFPKRRDIAANALMYDRKWKWWKKYYGLSTGRIDRLWQTRTKYEISWNCRHSQTSIKKPSPGAPSMALLSDREDLSPWQADQIESS